MIWTWNALPSKAGAVYSIEVRCPEDQALRCRIELPKGRIFCDLQLQHFGYHN
jgi:hypothetical protein